MTGHYSNQQGSKSRQNPCQVSQPTTSETYRRQDDVFGWELQFLLLSGVLPVFNNLDYKLYRKDCMCCPSNKVIKMNSKGTLCDTLQAVTPTNGCMCTQIFSYHTLHTQFKFKNRIGKHFEGRHSRVSGSFYFFCFCAKPIAGHNW